MRRDGDQSLDGPAEADSRGTDGTSLRDGETDADVRPPPDAGAADLEGDDAATLQTNPFSAVFKRLSGDRCASSQDFQLYGFAPAASGSAYPLLIYTVGTLDAYNNVHVRTILEEAASRGFVAVSPQYDNNLVWSCDDVVNRAKCIYDGTDSGSAMAVLCARHEVDCSLGVVTVGHSQGAGLAMYAKNFEPRVRAMWGLGASCDFVFSFGQGDNPGLCNPDNPEQACLLDRNTMIPPERVRLTTGENDEFGHQNEYQRLSGTACPPGTSNCLRQDGSGWYIIANSEVQDGDADHVYFVFGDSLDPGFAPDARHAWSLSTNLSWLASFTGSG